MAKRWYKSKTMQTNISAIIGMAMAWWFEGVSPMVALPVVGMGIVNLILRIVTKQPVE